jgi:hypothetical protein
MPGAAARPRSASFAFRQKPDQFGSAKRNSMVDSGSHHRYFIRHVTGDRDCCAPASFEGSIMPESHSLLAHFNVQIHRPECPKCHAHMMLARITPARTGFDFRTFECPKCDHVHEVMVANEAFGS